ncbi:hydroxymethylpyrimidine/phosphomethylpyrimidine kinase [uncultured Salinisphaera sp.]|uniref:bifunctional hydroxymethylpyrimidine kinase/phosphomethylpyrimidine kinase n=1 Tax=uncultured Salinisphaera sp. TaxID=359372 RepID=UPI0032B1C019|tara:strand:- start:486 stop:1259 length:774 start_codon:yes stop_codon:yes gene_type:complete
MQKPNTLVIAGHDPSGGAGIQADIEAIAAAGGHAATLVTALTCQDTANVYDVRVTDDAFFADCLARVVHDMTLNALKTGVLASRFQVEQVAALAGDHPDMPIVIDPVLVASGGGRLAEDLVGRCIRDTLLPRATLATPNAREARALCDDEPDLARCGRELARAGGYVLITGGDTPGHTVVNRLFDASGEIERYTWPRLDGVFHGSGCTLASSIAARLAAGQAIERAVHDAQKAVQAMLAGAFNAGRGQAVPDRLIAR